MDGIIVNLEGTAVNTSRSDPSSFICLLFPSCQQIVAELPEAAKAKGVQFIFWQPIPPSTSGNVWAIDTVYVGDGKPSGTGLQSIELNFNASGQAPDPSQVLLGNGAMGNFCDRTALVFGGYYGPQYLTTYATALPASGAIMQLEVATGCDGTPTALAQTISVLYTDDNGATWSQLYQRCAPTSSPTCLTVQDQSLPLLTTYAANGFRRLQIPLPDTKAGRRYRLYMGRGNSGGSSAWALASFTVTARCSGYCSGHGICRDGVCQCDAGFGHASGSAHVCEPSAPLPTTLRETFDDALPPTRWNEIIGARLVLNGGGCGTLAAAQSLRFDDAGDRRAVTADLNLEGATLIQFVVQMGTAVSTGSCPSPNSNDDQLLVTYSIDGGVTWNVIDRVAYYAARSPTHFYTILPAEALTPATRVMLWMPTADNQNIDVVNVDDLYIGYANTAPVRMLQDNWSSSVDVTQWLFYPNFGIDGCDNRQGALVTTDASIAYVYSRDVTTIAAEEVHLTGNMPTDYTPSSGWTAPEGARTGTGCGLHSNGWIFDKAQTSIGVREIVTRDFNITSGDVELKFYLALGGGGCDPPDGGGASDENVYLSFSTNGGASWTEMASYTALTTPGTTVSYIMANYPATLKGATRFRWRQSSFNGGSDGSDVWALTNVTLRGIPKLEPTFQFDYNLGCDSAPSSDAPVFELSYSTNYGTTWTTCALCTPLTSSNCNTWSRDCAFRTSASPADKGWLRAYVKLASTNQNVRYRFSSRGSHPFALANVRLSLDCPAYCGGHGRCDNGQCVCDTGYHRDTASGSCEADASTLPTIFREDFEASGSGGEIDGTRWLQAHGRLFGPTSSCGAVGRDVKFLSYGNSPRYLVTRDINTTYATFLEFFAKTGDGTTNCERAESQAEGVSVGFSVNGGVTYTSLYNVLFR